MSVEEKMKEIFGTVLSIDPAHIGPDLAPANTPTWDSLNAIVLITEIEKAFEMRFSYQEAMGIGSFGDAVAFVTKKVQEQ